MDTKKLDASSDVASQHMVNQIHGMEDVERMSIPRITMDGAELQDIRETADFLFNGIIGWRMTGAVMHLGLWDTITFWMGVTECYLRLLDEPELMHALMERMTVGTLAIIDQMEGLGVMDGNSHYCHCSHTYQAGQPENPPHPTAKDSWAFGMAQLFTSVSPQITDAFEVAYMQRIFPRFGNIYYGCCDRLDDRLDIIAKLPNVRKISCSPWSDRERFAAGLDTGRYIMSAKPNPAMLATLPFHENAVRADLRRTMDAARANGVTLELILKDVSTVAYRPENLRRWTEIAAEEAERG